MRFRRQKLRALAYNGESFLKNKGEKMENYKTIVALARIKELRKAGDYESAYSLAKDLEVKRISDPLDCNMLLDVYKENSDYDRSIQVAEKIYKRNKSRHALNSLVYFGIKTNDAQRAKEYLEKYEVAAPKDPQRLVFRYRIQKLEKAPYEDRIATLEKWKKEQYTERWALELAKLYHKVGDDYKCLDECDRIIETFEEGEYVEWAKTLKAHLQGESDVIRPSDAPSFYPEQETGVFTPVGDEPAEKPLPEEFYEEPESTEFEAPESTGFEAPESTGFEGAGADGVDDDLSRMLAESVQTELALENAEVTGTVVPENLKKRGKKRKDKAAQKAAAIPETQDVVEITQDSFGVGEVVAPSADEASGETAADVPAPGEEINAAQDNGSGEEEIAVMQNFMKYFEENSSATVKLRDDHEPVTEIPGELGRMLTAGTVVLEDYFGNYARIESVRKQLIRSLAILFDPVKRGSSMIITGGPKTGKTALAKKIAKTLNKFNISDSKKALIVNAKKLNSVSLKAKEDQLKGCTVIVENAGELSVESVKDLIDFGAKHAEDSLLFLEDDRVSMNELMRVCPEIGGVFNNRIHLPQEYSVDELKGYIYEYFVKNEFELETTADNAITDKLEKIMKMKPESPIDSALAIAKSATEAAEARNAALLAEMVKNGKIENSDIMTIRAEDV